MQKSYNDLSYIENYSEEEGPPQKLVFLFHGYAQRASYMNNVLAAKMRPHLPKVKFISVNGLHECKGYEGKGRYDWLRYNGSEWNPDVIRIVAADISKIIEDFIYKKTEEHGLTVSDIAMIGFSQGTRVCLHTSLRMQKCCACVIGYSGALSLPELITAELVSRPDIMLIHGYEDEVLPYTESLRAQKVLLEHDINVEVKLIKELEHKIGVEATDVGLEFLKKHFKNNA